MKILVPIDFTPVTEKALDYAQGLPGEPRSLHLLHVVEEDSHRAEALERLKSLADAHNLPGETDFLVQVGSIFEQIGQTAEEIKAGLVVMGTHGAKGLQKLFGSHAIRVVTSAKTPFIVTQAEVEQKRPLQKIVVPLALEKEEKKVLSVVATLAAPLKAEVLIFCQDPKDEFLRNQLNRNASFARKFLAERGVSSRVQRSDSKESFDRATVSFAQAENADLIAVINKHQDGYLNLFGKNFDQNLITNAAHIPVLTLNTDSATDVHDIFRTLA